MSQELRQLLKDLWPFRNTIAIVAVTGIIMSIAQSRIPVEAKNMFDGLESKDINILKQTPLVILALTLIAAVCRYFHLYLMDVAADRLTIDLRKRLQDKLMSLSISFHGQFKTGSGGLISRILNDLIEIQLGLRLVADVFREPALFICLVGYLIYLNWQLTLTLLLILPPLAWFLKQLAKSLRKYGHKSQQVMEDVTTTIKESLDGVRTIQAFNLEKEMSKRFDREAEEFIDHRKKIHSRTEISGPVTETLATIVVVAIFTFMGMKIVKGQATLGDFGGYLAALLMLQKPIKKLQESFVKVQQTLVSIRRVYEILDSDTVLEQSKNPKGFPSEWKEIQFSDVSYAYNTEPVLKDIDLNVSRGEVVAFVGASGSGKSTLVNLLGRFFDPTNGRIEIDGVNLKEFDLQQLRKNVALVSQDVFLFRDTIKRNIHAGDFDADAANIEAAAKLANAHDFILKQENSYDTQVGDRGGNLSGGEKQRISIARAIFKDAPILILDEATSALDSSSEADVQAGLDHLMQGRTVFIVAHRLSTIKKADRIVVLNKGRVSEVGSHDELISSNGEYRNFYDLQMQSHSID